MKNFIVLFLCCLLFSCNDDLNKPEIVVKDFHSSNGEKIFLKRISWGLLGDSFKIYLSANDKLDYNYIANNDMQFYDNELFYRFANDTLNIVTMKKYSGASRLPKGFVIVQREVDNLELQTIWMKDYKKMGYSKLN